MYFQISSKLTNLYKSFCLIFLYHHPYCRKKGNPDEPVCIALSSDEEGGDDENSNQPTDLDKTEEIDIEEQGREGGYLGFLFALSETPWFLPLAVLTDRANNIGKEREISGFGGAGDGECK